MLDFEQGFREGFPRVYRVCLAKFGDAEFAKEITQEAFVRAFINLHQLRDETKFLPWVMVIAFRFGYLKIKHDRERWGSLPDDDMLGQGYNAAAMPSPRLEGDSFFTRWIKTLKESDYRLFVLRYYYRMPMQEISERAGRPLGTVKRRLAELKSKLKDALEHQREDN